MIKKIISVCLALTLCFGIFAVSANAVSTDAKLTFNSDGKFKIVQLTDFQDTHNPSAFTNSFIKYIAESEKPDLFVLTGDNISEAVSQGYSTENSERRIRKAIKAFMSTLDEIGIPVAVVFGNHDDEGKTVSKEVQMTIYNEYSCCIAVDEGDSLYGCGTYDIPIYSSDGSKIAFELYLFDSNSYDENGNYDYIHEDQLQWYQDRSDELMLQNGGKRVPALAFQHIVVPEIYSDEIEILSGAINENPCPSGTDTQQVEMMLKNGDVLGMFFGHDHKNDFVADYNNLKLINTSATGFGSYGGDNRGARVICLDETNLDIFETRMVYYLDDYCDNIFLTLRYYLNCLRYIFVYAGYGLTYPIKMLTNSL